MSSGQASGKSIHSTYQLHIELACPLHLTVGRLGVFDLPAGQYVYTGSARRNLEARIARHRSEAKTLHWHIDYLLASPHAFITAVHASSELECYLNQHTRGTIPIPGFGASDCKSGCGSHLKLL